MESASSGGDFWQVEEADIVDEGMVDEAHHRRMMQQRLSQLESYHLEPVGAEPSPFDVAPVKESRVSINAPNTSLVNRMSILLSP